MRHLTEVLGGGQALSGMIVALAVATMAQERIAGGHQALRAIPGVNQYRGIEDYLGGATRELRSSYNHIQKHDHTHKHEQGHKHTHTQEHVEEHKEKHEHVADHTHEHEHVHKHKHNHIHDVLEAHQHAHSHKHAHTHKGYESRRRGYERAAVDHTRNFLKNYMRGTYSRLTGY